MADTPDTPRFYLRHIALPVWRAIRRLSQPDVRIVTGGIAFYALFSIFPLIYLTLTLLIALLPREISEQIAGSIGQILTTNVAPLNDEELTIISRLTPQALTVRAFFAVLLVGFTATSGAKAAITGLRMIAGTSGRSGVIKFQGMSLLLTALLVLTVWLLGGLQIAVTLVRDMDSGPAVRFAGAIATLASTLWITKFVASFAVFYLLIALSLRGRQFDGWPKLAGAAIGSLAWIMASWAYGVYLRIGVLDTLYGALASVILGFIWLIASVSSLLLGAALAVEWARARHL